MPRFCQVHSLVVRRFATSNLRMCLWHVIRSVVEGAKRPRQRLNSPAPEANKDTAKATFYAEMAKVKTALAFGVGCSDLLGFYYAF